MFTKCTRHYDASQGPDSRCLDFESPVPRYTDTSGVGPGFSETFVGAIYTVGYAGMLVGVAVYNRYLKDFTYRRVFLYAQLLLAFVGERNGLFLSCSRSGGTFWCPGEKRSNGPTSAWQRKEDPLDQDL